jgi:hypothetical protein
MPTSRQIVWTTITSGCRHAFCHSNDLEKRLKGTNSDSAVFPSIGNVRCGSAGVPPSVKIYDGPTQKEGIVTIEVEPAAKGETKFDLEGVISVCREK